MTDEVISIVTENNLTMKFISRGLFILLYLEFFSAPAQLMTVPARASGFVVA
ncbi:MAG: hypothetical protein V2B20_14830 [Pseudomonadota bacterium]